MNGKPDVFRFDRKTGETALVSVALNGGSADGFSGGRLLLQSGSGVARLGATVPAVDARMTSLALAAARSGGLIVVHDLERSLEFSIIPDVPAFEPGSQSSMPAIAQESRAVAFEVRGRDRDRGGQRTEIYVGTW